LIHAALWGLVLTGAAGGACAAIRPAPAPAQPQRTQADVTPPGVAGAAEVAARRWLTDHARTDRPDTTGVLTIDDLSVVAIRDTSTRFWTVTVAVTLHPTDRPPTIWYLEVGVASTRSGLRPVGTPAVVPPPMDATPLSPRSVPLQVPAPDDPLAGTAEAFLRALLTGAGDPVRYASPDATPFRPTGNPFTELELDRIGILSRRGERTRIRVAVRASTHDGGTFALLYELQLRERDGRWEVESLASASRPGSEPDEPPSSPSTTTTTTTTTSTVAGTPGA
jgi:hypothetical protein